MEHKSWINSEYCNIYFTHQNESITLANSIKMIHLLKAILIAKFGKCQLWVV